MSMTRRAKASPDAGAATNVVMVDSESTGDDEDSDAVTRSKKASSLTAEINELRRENNISRNKHA